MDGLNKSCLQVDGRPKLPMGGRSKQSHLPVDSLNAKSPTGVDQSRLRVDDLYTKSPTGGQTTKVDE